MFLDRTGRNGLAGCRAAYSDCDSFGFGFVARDTWTGCLDAPDFMPQGSCLSGRLSLANRDRITGCAHPGTCHDA